MKIRSYKGQLVRLNRKGSKTSTVQNVTLYAGNNGPVEKWDCYGPIFEVENRDVLGREFADHIQGEPVPDKAVSLKQVTEARRLEDLPDPVIEGSAQRGHGG